MNAIDDRLALIERRRQMMVMMATCGGGLIMAGFGLTAYIVDPDHSRGMLVWVALGGAWAVAFQLRLLRQMMRGKDKGTA